MARRIIDAGYPTTLWARRPETLEPFADTAAATAATLAELGAASDVLCVCVVADAGVDEVLRGPHGALATWRAARSSSCTARCTRRRASGCETTSRAAGRRRAGERRRPQGRGAASCS